MPAGEPNDSAKGKGMHIELRGVLKSYGRVRALNRVSLEITPGQIVSVLGPNGAGKTTLLRCLAGIASPDAGEVYYDGEPFRRDRLDIRRRFCFLPDTPLHFWDQTVIRNIGIYLRLYGADGDGVEDRVLELLRDFDLLPLAESSPAFLSRGQAYKSGLVSLLAIEPDIWLIDEPFASGMDPHGIDAFKRHARAAAIRGCTIIYSTQLLDVAERFSDRVCVIHEGDLRAFDTLDALREKAANKADVLGGLFRQLREQRP
jgi:ABC-type multidrug transport system ATPase subunit